MIENPLACFRQSQIPRLVVSVCEVRWCQPSLESPGSFFIVILAEDRFGKGSFLPHTPRVSLIPVLPQTGISVGFEMIPGLRAYFLSLHHLPPGSQIVQKCFISQSISVALHSFHDVFKSKGIPYSFAKHSCFALGSYTGQVMLSRERKCKTYFHRL
jgi:hypothetical protein